MQESTTSAIEERTIEDRSIDEIKTRVTGRRGIDPLETPGSDSSDDLHEWTGNVGTIRNEALKVGRNVPCRCGSGKKFKKCCGAAG